MSETLIQTKLYIPLLRPKLVSRPQLIEKLNQGLQQGHKLTLVSAPAGFGKTTLVTEWVNQKVEGKKPVQSPVDGIKDEIGGINQPSSLRLGSVSTPTPYPSQVAWLSLDEGDHDHEQFLLYLVAALNQARRISAPSEDTVPGCAPEAN